jgi:Tol biopolymer transport system component
LAATGIERCYVGRCPTNIYVLEVESGELFSLTTTGSEGGPEWTSDPEVVSFVDDTKVYTVGLDGNNPVPFITGGFPSWSPDGRFVAVVRQNREADLETGLTLTVDVRDVKAGKELRIFETPQGAEQERISKLAWSPDSTQIAISATWWTTDTGRIRYIFIVNADGSNLRRVSTGAIAAGWMPDGDWLYFLVGDGQLGFAPLNFDCVLTPLDITDMGDPVISPSGEQMAFVHNGNMYLLSLDRLLGANREKLVCPNE